MSPAEAARIKAAAIENGRRERREQGIPEQIRSADHLAATIAALLRGEGRRE